MMFDFLCLLSPRCFVFFAQAVIADDFVGNGVYCLYVTGRSTELVR